MAARLGELTDQLKIKLARYTAGRYLQALSEKENAIGFAEAQRHWADRSQVIDGLKAAVSSIGTGDLPGPLRPVAEAFVIAMRSSSVPLRLENLRHVPLHTRVFISSSGVTASQVAQGGAIPVLKSDWTATTLEPRKFGAVVIQTEELLKNTSPGATLAIVDDLAAATAEAENLSFCDPNEVGSVFFDAENFASSGATVADKDADLLHLVSLVPAASRPGATLIMGKGTATNLGLTRGSGGGAAYADVGPQGGSLLGLPVLITSACEFGGSPSVNMIGLISPSDIFWSDEGKVILTTSNAASLKMDDAADATAGNTVSMYQTNSVATKAVRESAWFARAGAAAYFTCPY